MRSTLALEKVLPPPAYIQLPSMGVDISDTSLKYIYFKPRYGGEAERTIASFGDVDIADDALARGEVHDVNALGNAMSDAYKATQVPYVRISLPEERAYIFETSIKRGTSLKEIRAQIEFQLEEHVPISPRDSFFDYDIIAEHERSLTVAVVVYARETIMNYYEACQMAGVTPLAFEVEAQAIARAIIPPDDPDTYMVVDFGKTRTGIGIVHRGSLLYTSTVDSGGATLSQALRTHLGDRPEKELTTLKNTKGLVPNREQPELHEVLLSAVSTIRDELATRLQYWHTRDHDKDERRIKQIILCGGSANLKGVPEYFTETLGVPTVRADVWQNVGLPTNTVPSISQRYSYGYATAIGLALKQAT